MAKSSAGRPDLNDKKRSASLFDAVAGRVGYEGFLHEQQQPSQYRDTASTSLASIPPDEVLFRRKGAPVRFEEEDVYSADRYLKARQPLPESDLLKVIHAYAADFYSSTATGTATQSLRSMDETALLAMGILLEETAAATLGETGEMAFVEPSHSAADNSANGDMYLHNGQWRKRVVNQPQIGRGHGKGHGRPRTAHTTHVTIRSKTGE